MNSEKIDLLKNAAATGAWFPVRGGRYGWSAEGTFSNANLQLQYQGPNGTAINVPNAVLYENSGIMVWVDDGSLVRVLITGGPPSGIYSSLVTMGQ